MKRYSGRFISSDPSLAPASVKDAVEAVLLRLHPRITYKMGQAITTVEGSMNVQFAVDGKRELLEEAFKENDWKLPVRFEGLGWGWMIDNVDAELLRSDTMKIDVDPLAGAVSFDGVREFPSSKGRLWGRYIALIAFTFLMIALLIANAIHTRLPVLEWLYILFFTIWLFVLNDTPFDFRVYAQKITIGQAGLEVIYWRRKRPTLIKWDQMWGMDYREPVCTVFSSVGRTRFLLSERFGCENKALVMKTIARRAALYFVEGNPRCSTYRKQNAN